MRLLNPFVQKSAQFWSMFIEVCRFLDSCGGLLEETDHILPPKKRTTIQTQQVGSSVQAAAAFTDIDLVLRSPCGGT